MEGAIWFGLIKLAYFHQCLETNAGALEQKDEETWHDQQEYKKKTLGAIWETQIMTWGLVIDIYRMIWTAILRCFLRHSGG